MKISEHFASIQGEGKSIGTPCVFLRTTGCNLLCQSKTWVCDTIEVWRKGNDMTAEQFINQYSHLLHLKYRVVVTGGEPLLQQDRGIADLCKTLVEEFGTEIEVETNGTIMPSEEIVRYVTQWNISPKLSNSGESERRRQYDVIHRFNDMPDICWKFVVATADDVFEYLREWHPHIKQKNMVYMMPAADTRTGLVHAHNSVMDICLARGLKVGTRLHLTIWDQATGV
jgi:organic radical activating enzyme